MRINPPRPRGGFTLTELLVVIAIIGIILTLILTAAQNARVVVQEAATQSLIQKLETAINDRLDALLQSRPDPNSAHIYLAGIYTGTTDNNGNLTPLAGAQSRAQVIAWYDFVKSEMPDVFVPQGAQLSYSNPQSNNYPLNFAANPYPGTTIDANGLGNYMLPLGNSVAGPLNPPTGPPGYGAGNYSNTVGTGIYGASYNAAAGIYKNLGYLPAGYDGVDNNNNGMIDDSAEGVTPPGSTPQTRPRSTWSIPTSPTTCTTRRGRRRCTPSSSRGSAPWARSSAATTSPRTKSRTPMATACPSSSMPGVNRSSSSAGRSSTTPTARRGR